MRRAVLLLAVAVLIAPFALMVGGHNGLTLLGVLAAVLSIALVISAPTRKEPN